MNRITPPNATVNRRNIVKLAAAASAIQLLPLQPAFAQDTVPRDQTLIIAGFSETPMWTNFSNANYYAPGVDVRNGLMFASEALFWYSLDQNKLIPWMAESYGVNSTFTKITITLRSGVTWSDGHPFTAKDVAFTYNMLIEDGKGKNQLRKAAELARKVKRVTAIDERTVQIELNQPDARHVHTYAVSFYSFGLYWLPEHVWKDVQDRATFTYFDRAKGWPLTTSAWKVARTSPNEIVLDRRDDWWAAQTKFHALPEPRRIVVIPGGSRDRVSQLIASNQIDTAADIQDPLLMEDLIKENPKITSYSGSKSPLGNLDWWPTSLYFNSADPQWNDRRVRHAVCHAINRDQFVLVGSGGHNKPNLTPYPAFLPLQAYVNAAESEARKQRLDKQDLVACKALMTEAGYLRDEKGFWAKGGKRVGGDMHGVPVLNQYGPILQQQLRKAGFDVTFRSTPDSRRLMMNGEVPLMLFGHNGGSTREPLATLEMYHSKNKTAVGKPTFNMARFSDPGFDAAVDTFAAMVPGSALSMKAFGKAMEAWYAGLPEVPLQQWYHRVPMNTTYWTNWPTESNAYIAPAVNFESSPVYLSYKLKKSA